MTTPATSQPSTPPAEGSTPPAEGGTPPATPPASPPAAPEVDVTKLSDEQLLKVLEHPNFFNIPRVKELREKAAQADKLTESQRKAAEDKLKEEKKWEELSQQKETENATLREQIKNSNVNSALTALLVKENVVDLDGALKLVDRSNISVDDNGTVTGVAEALTALKTDKAYLFNGSQNPQVGNPSNPTGTQPTGPMKFKRSQLTQEFINANKDEVYKAMNAGLIEDDGPPPQG
jgi:hypothetical protein